MPDADLLPCFATLHPDAHAIIAAAVLILKDLILSPPVPHVSIKLPETLGVIAMALFFMLWSTAPSSCGVSPFVPREIRNEAIAASLAFPESIKSIEYRVSISERFSFATSLLMILCSPGAVSSSTHLFTIEMKFPNIFGPSSVNTDSGWNCTPSIK
jgi:hypothetical protein